MKLKKEFLDAMQEMLGEEEFESFLSSYEHNRTSGLRVNKLKIDVERFLEIFPFELKRIPWTDDGFYYDRNDEVTKHPYYHAGLYYIQEPSAMAPVSALEVKQGDIVLDLCAAPGGKTVQIASHMGTEGLIVTNDISAQRVKALVRNVEMAGIKNAIILNENHENIADELGSIFSKLLIDAPCSGEGMFRKEERMAKEWSPQSVETYVQMQSEIMSRANDLLQSGGSLVYSTCTYNRMENENQIISFMNDNDDYSVEDLPLRFPQFKKGTSLKETAYLMPHLLEGEGHFVSKLHKQGHFDCNSQLAKTTPPTEFIEFMNENMTTNLNGHFRMYKTKLYLSAAMPDGLDNLKIVRNGWYLGDIEKAVFEPSQALAMGIEKDMFKRVIDLPSTSLEVIKYLKGETLFIDGEDGINLVCVDGFPLGFGKLIKGTLKNKYAKAWRIM